MNATNHDLSKTLSTSAGSAAIAASPGPSPRRRGAEAMTAHEYFDHAITVLGFVSQAPIRLHELKIVSRAPREWAVWLARRVHPRRRRMIRVARRVVSAVLMVGFMSSKEPSPPQIHIDPPPPAVAPAPLPFTPAVPPPQPEFEEPAPPLLQLL